MKVFLDDLLFICGRDLWFLLWLKLVELVIKRVNKIWVFYSDKGWLCIYGLLVRKFFEIFVYKNYMVKFY